MTLNFIDSLFELVSGSWHRQGQDNRQKGIFMSQNISKVLIESGAVQLSPNAPFTFASGIKSPIYCDNRLLIGLVESRQNVIQSFLDQIETLKKCDLIAGTATAGIPWAAWIADKLNKPLVYVRSSAKEHGKGKQIEGAFQKGQSVLLVEDLISTGMSSLEAVSALQSEELIVNHCVAIFEYGFDDVKNRFKEKSVSYSTLTNLNEMLNYVSSQNKLTDNQIQLIKNWQTNPKEWGKS